MEMFLTHPTLLSEFDIKEWLIVYKSTHLLPLLSELKVSVSQQNYWKPTPLHSPPKAKCMKFHLSKYAWIDLWSCLRVNQYSISYNLNSSYKIRESNCKLCHWIFCKNIMEFCFQPTTKKTAYLLMWMIAWNSGVARKSMTGGGGA